MAIMPACQVGDPGSIPGRRIFSTFFDCSSNFYKGYTFNYTKLLDIRYGRDKEIIREVVHCF